MTISIIVVVLSCVASYCYAFFNIMRSFRVCVYARVFVHAYDSLRNYIHACNKTFFEGVILVVNDPLRRKLITGLLYHISYRFSLALS